MPALSDSLIHLDCSSTSLYTIPLPTTLKYLNCAYCTMNFPTLPDSLHYLNFTSTFANYPPNSFPNSLDTIMAGATAWSTIPTLPNHLIYLDLNIDGITTLPPLPSTLKYLDLYANFIACLPTLPDSLKYLNIIQTKIKCLPNIPSSAIIMEDSVYALCGPGNLRGCPNVVSGIQKVSDGNIAVDYYPNPANTELTVEVSQAGTYEIDLLDVNGKLILLQKMNVKTKMDLSNIEQGVYFLRIKSDQEILNKKITLLYHNAPKLSYMSYKP